MENQLKAFELDICSMMRSLLPIGAIGKYAHRSIMATNKEYHQFGDKPRVVFCTHQPKDNVWAGVKWRVLENTQGNE